MRDHAAVAIVQWALVLLLLRNVAGQGTHGAPTANGTSFNCHRTGDECLHDGLCSPDGRCDCSPSPTWFGRQCELRRCVPLYNPCLNEAACEKTDQSFRCHCPVGFAGVYCEKRVQTVCDRSSPCEHGECRLGGTVDEYQCKCHFGWTGRNCSEADHCWEDPCVNGHCVSVPEGALCQCQTGWDGQKCERDVDECLIEGADGKVCQNGGKCVNTMGSFFCECPAGFAGQHCQHQFDPSSEHCPAAWALCQNGAECREQVLATTAEWALDAHFHWRWECACLPGFEGEHCERPVDECATGRMTCVNGGRCARAWAEEHRNANGTLVAREWHPAKCKCPGGFTGEFCERDVDECEAFSGGLCQNGATCVNRHGSYFCLCVGGFEGRHCQVNIDDCVDNLCYAGSTCVDGISRYDCLCAPDRIGNLCEFPNTCFDKPCAHGQCYADPEQNGNYTCQCDEGWTGRNCDVDVDECADPATNRCVNGQCQNTVGGFRCDCEKGYSGELCNAVVRYCETLPQPCLNGGTCLDDLGRYDCVCLPGYSGERCEVRSYQEVNKCWLECENGGICKDAKARVCECPPPYAGILCEVEKRDPCDGNRCAEGSVCAQNPDYTSYSCQCPPYLSGQFCERKLAPCEGGYNPCVHGVCRNEHVSGGQFRCECLSGWTGQLCDRPSEEEEEGDSARLRCPLAQNPCLHGGQCTGVRNTSASGAEFFECVCPKGFRGPLCEMGQGQAECAEGCRNGGKCAQRTDGHWGCDCASGFEGPQCEVERNACAAMPCQHKSKCVNLDSDRFRCDCAPGWEGELCENDVDDCTNIVCANGGTCRDRVDSYACECSRGFTGRHCEVATMGPTGQHSHHWQVSVPVDRFNRTDVVDRESCLRNGCEHKAGDGKCDAECNLFACQFDGGDCSTRQTEPFGLCPQPSYCAHVFADGKCDEICNNERCLFDGFDCVPRGLSKCPHFGECARLYANGRCDQQCNMGACGWDGGDCDREAEPDPWEALRLLSGELFLVLLVPPSSPRLVTVLREFLVSLSAHLRASLSLSLDADGQAKLFEWHSNGNQLGPRIQLPPQLNASSMFSVRYEAEGALRSKRDAEAEAGAEGIALFLRVDVTMCNLIDTAGGQHHRFVLGSHSPCFSDMHSVAAYVGAANAKKTLQDIPVRILQSEARLPPRPSTVPWTLLLGLSMLSLAVLSVVGAVVRQERLPRRRLKTAKTWTPAVLEPGKTSATPVSEQQFHHYQLGYNPSSAGSCASSNVPLMISHSDSMTSLFSGQLQNIQQHSTLGHVSATPLSAQQYAYPTQPHCQYANSYPQHPALPLMPTQYPSSNQMGPSAEMAENVHMHHNANQTAAMCSRSSSSGIGGSSTEHSPLHATAECKGQTELLEALRQSAALGRQGLVGEEYKLEPNLVKAVDARGRTLLHLLFENPHLAAEDSEQCLLRNIHILFTKGATIDAQDNDGVTPLQLAVHKGKSAAVRNLVSDFEADPNLSDANGKTPLYVACEQGMESVAQFLIQGAKVQPDTLYRRKETPLMRCAQLRLRSGATLRIAEMLLERVDADKRADFANQAGDEQCIHFTGETALHLAAKSNNAEMVRLLCANGANKEALDMQGRSALFVAVEQAQVDSVRALLELGADRNKTNIDDIKISDLLSKPGFAEIAALFKQIPEQRSSQCFGTLNRPVSRATGRPSSRSSNMKTLPGGSGGREETASARKQRAGTKRSAAVEKAPCRETTAAKRAALLVNERFQKNSHDNEKNIADGVVVSPSQCLLTPPSSSDDSAVPSPPHKGATQLATSTGICSIGQVERSNVPTMVMGPPPAYPVQHQPTIAHQPFQYGTQRWWPPQQWNGSNSHVYNPESRTMAPTAATAAYPGYSANLLGLYRSDASSINNSLVAGQRGNGNSAYQQHNSSSSTVVPNGNYASLPVNGQLWAAPQMGTLQFQQDNFIGSSLGGPLFFGFEDPAGGLVVGEQLSTSLTSLDKLTDLVSNQLVPEVMDEALRKLK